MSAQRTKILCPACGLETYARSEPVYEGFKKVGEKFSCIDCGHAFDDVEDLPVVEASRLAVFSDEDRSARITVFDHDEVRFCRGCVSYIVNPFTQYCNRHKKEVQATDTCDDFERKQEDGEDSSEAG